MNELLFLDLLATVEVVISCVAENYEVRTSLFVLNLRSFSVIGLLDIVLIFGSYAILFEFLLRLIQHESDNICLII